MLRDTNTVEVLDMASGTSDSLDFSEQVDAFSMGHSRLVVATGRQARVYTISSTSGATLTPAATVDMSDMLLDIKLAARCFLLLLATSGPQVCGLWPPLQHASRATTWSAYAPQYQGEAPLVQLTSGSACGAVLMPPAICMPVMNMEQAASPKLALGRRVITFGQATCPNSHAG